jgi:hypothetical protein
MHALVFGLASAGSHDIAIPRAATRGDASYRVAMLRICGPAAT